MPVIRLQLATLGEGKDSFTTANNQRLREQLARALPPGMYSLQFITTMNLVGAALQQMIAGSIDGQPRPQKAPYSFIFRHSVTRLIPSCRAVSTSFPPFSFSTIWIMSFSRFFSGCALRTIRRRSGPVS